MKRFRLVFYLLAIAATWLVRHHPFFWDTIQLASKHAHYFYENGFPGLLLPVEMDSGHPPFFGLYLAGLWALFGKTLPVSHFAMLPFLLLIVFFSSKIGKWINVNQRASWLTLLLFADPVFASQSVLVSPDIPLVCFFLAGVYALMSRNHLLLTAGVLGLCLVSMRGMMVVAALYVVNLVFLFTEGKRKRIAELLQTSWPFLPGTLTAAGFLLLHWQQTGWIGYHPESPWAPSFEGVDFGGLVRNLGIFSWRLADFGHLFLLLVLGAVLFVRLRQRGFRAFDRKEKIIIALIVSIFFCTVPVMLLHKGLLGHRYLLPLWISVVLLFLKLATSCQKRRHWLYGIALAGLLSGNYWVYPKSVATGWDSTLAHLPWYELQATMNDTIRDKGIRPEKVGTAFPNIGPRKYIELSAAQEGYTEKNLDQNCYILYSNVMNDFTDEEIARLESTWEPITTLQKGSVHLILFKHPGACEN